LDLSMVVEGQKYHENLGITCHHVLVPGINGRITLPDALATPQLIESPSASDHF